MDATVVVQPPSAWHLRIVQGPMTGQVLPLKRTLAVIGRDSSCDVVINALGVSRRHAQLTFQGQWFSIQDLGSTNGTFVNGVRIAGTQVLQPGDLVSLGTEVTFVIEWDKAAPGVDELTLPQYTPVTPAPSPKTTKKTAAGWLWPLIGCGVLALLGFVVLTVVVLMMTHIVPNPFVANTATPTWTATATATATLIQLITPTPTATWTPTAAAIQGDTPTPLLTPQPTSTPTPTETATPTPEPTATDTPPPTPTDTPSPTPTPQPTSTPTPTWTPTPLPTPTPRPTSTPTPKPLVISWELLEKKCISKEQWKMKFRLMVGGGSGQYVYYRDVEQIYGPTTETQYIYELTYGKASAVGTFYVESGGQRAESKFWVEQLDCSGYTP